MSSIARDIDPCRIAESPRVDRRGRSGAATSIACAFARAWDQADASAGRGGQHRKVTSVMTPSVPSDADEQVDEIHSGVA